MGQGAARVEGHAAGVEARVVRFHVRNRQSTERHTLYFVLAPSAEMLKIGITSDFAKRMRNLRCGSPVSLCCLLHLRGTATHEGALHRAFSEERRQGEWFIASPRLLAFVERLRRSGQNERVAELDALVSTPLKSWQAWEQPNLDLTGRQRSQGRRPGFNGGDPKDEQRRRAARLWSRVEDMFREHARSA